LVKTAAVGALQLCFFALIREKQPTFESSVSAYAAQSGENFRNRFRTEAFFE
jgi:hypothetical protein